MGNNSSSDLFSDSFILLIVRSIYFGESAGTVETSQKSLHDNLLILTNVEHFIALNQKMQFLLI
jgi:hypothetical protein